MKVAAFLESRGWFWDNDSWKDPYGKFHPFPLKRALDSTCLKIYASYFNCDVVDFFK